MYPLRLQACLGILQNQVTSLGVPRIRIIVTIIAVHVYIYIYIHTCTGVYIGIRLFRQTTTFTRVFK